MLAMNITRTLKRGGGKNATWEKEQFIWRGLEPYR